MKRKYIPTFESYRGKKHSNINECKIGDKVTIASGEHGGKKCTVINTKSGYKENKEETKKNKYYETH